MDGHSQDSETGPASALHSSFDAALLRDGSEIGLCGSLFGDEDKLGTPRSPSWEESEPSLGELSGKKHLRPRARAETIEANPPGTVRKQARRAVHGLSAKTPGRPRLRPPGSMKKPANSTPSSAAKRRRAPLPQRQSPMRRALPTTPAHFQTSSWTPCTSGKPEHSSFLNGLVGTSFVASPQALTPAAQGGPSGTTAKSMSKCHNTGTTAASTALLETTFASDSLGTSSPTTTRFRFTSFPASLPRVNNPRNRQNPDSVRKRMSFVESNTGNEANQSREDDQTHNTSISSLSVDCGHHHLPPAPGSYPPAILELNSQRASEVLYEDSARPVHAKLFSDEDNFGYSDDDSTDSPVCGIVERTRLNFNMVLSPQDEENGKKDTGMWAWSDHLYETFGDFSQLVCSSFVVDGTTLMPLDLHMELSRPYDQRRINSFASSISSNTHMHNGSGCEGTGGAFTPARLGDKERPMTPREVQLHFPLDTECSPIPGIREEPVHCEVDHHDTDSGGSPVGDRLIPGNSKFKAKDEESITSDSTNGKSRRLRPMPDMAAFESAAVSSRGDRSTDDSATLDSKGMPSTQRLLCPPTPVRTPAWANEGGAHAFFPSRQNSLITTKVLLSVPSHVVQGRCSLESSVLDEDSKASGRKFPQTTSRKNGTQDGSETRGAAMSDDDVRNADGSATANFPGSQLSGADSAVKTPRISAPPRLMRRIPPSPQEVGSVISFSNDFEILGVLGSGTFGDVYKVRSVRDNRLYAVKRNRRQFRGKRDRDMALAEVQSMQRLQSVCAETGVNAPGSSEKSSYCLYLLFFYRAWQEDGYFLCQTELCCRDTCRELLDSLRFFWNSAKNKYPSLLRNLPAPDNIMPGSDKDAAGRLVPNMTVWKICHDTAAGLSHIHSHGLVHQDIKPSNIFFVAHPRFGAMCKIGDFGMAGEIGSSGDGLEGDAKYMPPELLSSGARRPSSDIFSLGLTLYEIATDQQVELPSEGPRWHDLRSATGPKLPDFRGDELLHLIKSMMNPFATKRPTADAILKSREGISAGNRCDTFLRDYIHDTEEFDRLEDERLAMDSHEDQTPRNGSHRSSVVPVRSPSAF
jgi:membrane-associated tyrosine/threonine-specific cdc2-inhibitory kinase